LNALTHTENACISNAFFSNASIHIHQHDPIQSATQPQEHHHTENSPSHLDYERLIGF
jgi:hypothetical protein